MTYKTFYVKDNYINTTIYDDSAVTVPEVVLPKRLTILQPIFSSKGKANKILDFSSSSLVKSTYGEDMENIKKYGQGGLNLIHAMGGGASAQVCRLLPDNATIATALVKLVATVDDAIPVYERDDENNFVYEEVDGVMQKVQKVTGEGDSAVPVTIGGLKFKLIIDSGVDASATADGNLVVNEDETVYTIPLFKLVYNGAGKCGNSIGFTLENDFERDDVVDDGRRYILTLYELDETGNQTQLGNPFYFALNNDARIVTGSQVYEHLQYVFPNKDDAGNERQVICKPYINDNWEDLKTLIGKYCTSDQNAIDIDPLNCVDKNDKPYDNFVKDEDSAIIGSDATYYLSGGSDGDLQEGYSYEKTIDGETVTVTVTKEIVENTKKSLLKSFFCGQIDPALFDERMIASDIVFDANYDFEIVKPAMLGKFRDIRPDIMVIADIGDATKNCAQAINLVKNIYSMVDGSAGYTAAVLIHAGYTTDRAFNYHVTGTYDYSYGLARCYGLFGTFSVFAGYKQAKVTTMEYDWLPYKDEFDTMIGPLRKLGCIFAFQIDRAGTVAYMSEENMYTQSTSKLKSIRNGMVIGDAVRLGKAILIKYVYDNDGAVGAIRKASGELGENLTGRYPSNITVVPELFQSERDKLLDTSSCNLIYYFPGMTKGWSLNIYAKRADA